MISYPPTHWIGWIRGWPAVVTNLCCSPESGKTHRNPKKNQTNGSCSCREHVESVSELSGYILMLGSCMCIDVIWSIRFLTLETPSKPGWLGYSKNKILQLNRKPTSISLPVWLQQVEFLMVYPYLVPYIKGIIYHIVIWYVYHNTYHIIS